MHNLHTDLLNQLAHSSIDARVEAAARASAADAAHHLAGRRRSTGRLRPRHRFPRVDP